MIRIILLASLLIFSALEMKAQPADAEYSAKLGLRAMKLMNQGDFEEALPLLDEAASRDPGNITYPYEKALCYFKMTFYDDALKILDTLRYHEDATDQIYQLLGACYDFFAEKEKAIEVYNEGLEKFPDSGRLYMELGITELGRDQQHRAAGYWELGIEVDPAFDLNYYYYIKHYANRTEKVWLVLYGEIFLNLSRNQSKIEEISAYLFELYRDALFGEGDSLNPNFSHARFVTAINSDLEKYPFQGLVQMFMEEAAAKVFDKRDSLDVEKLSKLRAEFIRLWYGKSLHIKYPNIIFERLAELKRHNFLEAYDWVLFSGADKQAFKQEYNDNYLIFRKFDAWLDKNPFVIDKEKNFNINQY